MSTYLSEIIRTNSAARTGTGYAPAVAIGWAAESIEQPTNPSTYQDKNAEFSSHIQCRSCSSSMVGNCDSGVITSMTDYIACGTQSQQKDNSMGDEARKVADAVGQDGMSENDMREDALNSIENLTKAQTLSEYATAEAGVIWWAEVLGSISAFYAGYGCGLAIGYYGPHGGSYYFYPVPPYQYYDVPDAFGEDTY